MPSFACEERQREDAGRCSVCLIATATPRELPPIARTSCLCTGCNGSGEWDFRWSSRAGVWGGVARTTGFMGK
jgi:hypothetical protein